jgi:hypothetical protein
LKKSAQQTVQTAARDCIRVYAFILSCKKKHHTTTTLSKLVGHCLSTKFSKNLIISRTRLFPYNHHISLLQLSDSSAWLNQVILHKTAIYLECDVGMMTTQLGTPRGRYDEYSSKFSLSKKPRFIDLVGKSQTLEGDTC